jgi:hypothetical protein
MGSVNYGNQVKTVEINSDAADYTYNIRSVGIVPTGIYSGGFLKIVSGNNFKLTSFVAEMMDSTLWYQIKLQTQADITLTAVSTTPYIILNWQYSQVLGQNYVDVLQVADPASYPNCLIVGKGTFSGATLTGFVYYEQSAGVLTWQRSVPNDPRFKFKLEFDPDTSTRDVWIFPGMVPNISGANITGTLSASFHKINIPTSGGALNYIIYFNRSQAPGYYTLTLSTTYPAGSSFVVIAELNSVPGSGAIPATCYRDVRHFTS